MAFKKTKKPAFEYRPLTDNFKANMLFMGIGFGVLVLGWGAGSVVYSHADVAMFEAVAIGYFLGSYWFSPDLDHIDNRPGKHSFPIKPLVKIMRNISLNGGRAGRLMVAVPLVFCEVFHGTLNILWRMAWQPFASAVTHRGIIHWPLIGTLLKWYWVAVILYLVSMASRYIPANDLSAAVSSWNVGDLLPVVPRDFLTSDRSLFGSLFFGSRWTQASNFAVGLISADLTHIMVDMWDSRGRSFLPPAIIAPRGLLYRIVKAITGFMHF